MDTQPTVAEQWEEQLRAVRARIEQGGGRPGVVPAQEARGMSGLAIMEALLDGRFPYAHIAETLDFFLVEVEKGKATFQGTPQAKHLNPMGTVHGGWYATLLDSALGCAVQSLLPAGKAYTTAELKINIVRPLTDKTPLVRAEATIVHSGGRMATAEGRLTGSDGKLYAHGSTTCFLLDHG